MRARRHVAALGLLGAVLLTWGAVMGKALLDARLPDTASGKVLVMFSPRLPAEQAFTALIAAGARPVRPLADFLWVAQSDEAGLAGRLRAAGALGVFREFAYGPTLAGCLAYVSSEAGSASTRRRITPGRSPT